MTDLFSNPIFILSMIAFVLAVMIPWLKIKAKKTTTVVDDRCKNLNLI